MRLSWCERYRGMCSRASIDQQHDIAVPKKEEGQISFARIFAIITRGDLCRWMDVGLCTLIFILIAIVVANLSEDRCSVGELERCLEWLQSVARSENQALATTRKELQLVCRKLQKGVKCVDEHSIRCFNSAQQRIFDSVVSESRQVIEGLCVEGPLQEDYLRYAPCFKNISTDERKCAKKYKTMVVLSQDTEGKDKETALKTVCCALTEFATCKYEHVVRDCPAGAAHFLQTHMDRMSGSLINQHCVVYTYGSDSCGPSDTSCFSHAAFSPMFIISVSVTTLLFLNS